MTATNEGQAQLLAIKGSLASIAARCGVKKPAVSKWRGGAIPADAARALLWSEYGIPVRAWDLKPQPPAAPAAPVTRYADLDPEDAEIQLELDELTRDISDDACRSHPLYRDLLTIIRDVLGAHWPAAWPAHNALLRALNDLEDDIEADGWRPWRRPTTPEGQPE